MSKNFIKSEKIEKISKELSPKNNENAEAIETKFVSLCKKIILFGTFLILFTPLVINGNFLFPFVSAKSIYFIGLVLIIFTAYLLLISLDSKYRPKLNIVLISLVIFIIVASISSFLGDNPSFSFWSKYERMTGLLMLLHCLAFFVVMSSVFKSQKDWLKIFGVSVFAALLTSIVFLFLKINVNLMGPLGNISQEGAFLGNSSFMGTYLLFNIFLALYLFFKTKHNFKIYSGVSLVIILSALFTSNARAAVIALLGGLLLLFISWLIFSQKGKLKLVGAGLLAVCTVSVSLIGWLAFQPGSFVYERFIQMGFGARLIIWQSAWQGFLERPWFGWGLENFNLALTRHFNPLLFLPEYGGEVWFDRAHNIIIDTLITTGIIGFLAYLGIFVSAFYLLWQRYFKSSERVCFLTAGIFSSLLIAYFVQNLTVFDMVSSFMMFFLVLGFVASITSNKEQDNFLQKNVNHLNPLVAIIVFVFMGFSFFYFVIQPIKVMNYMRRAQRAMPFSSERIELYKKIPTISPIGVEQIRIFFADSAINLARTKITEQVNQEDIKKKFEFLIKELEKNINTSPLDFRSHISLGSLYSIYINNNPEKFTKAEEVVKKAIELNPNHPYGYWLLAYIKEQKGDFEAAIDIAKQSIEIEPRIDTGHFILVQTAIMKGDRDLAYKKAKEAIKINPAWEYRFKEILNVSN